MPLTHQRLPENAERVAVLTDVHLYHIPRVTTVRITRGGDWNHINAR
jgi:hypothetical protein